MFRRPKKSRDTAAEIETFEYRRLGDGLAAAAVKMSEAPAEATLKVVSGDETHQIAGSADAQNRLWFVVDLSLVMFGDAEYALVVDETEHELPEPDARPAPEGDDAAVKALEQLYKTALAANETLKEDGRRTAKVVAATLDDVQTERLLLLKDLQNAERVEKELRAELAAQGDMLALVQAALRAERDRFGAVAAPAE